MTICGHAQHFEGTTKPGYHFFDEGLTIPKELAHGVNPDTESSLNGAEPCEETAVFVTLARDSHPHQARPHLSPQVPMFRLTCLTRLAIVLQLHTSRAGTGVEWFPRGQQAQVGTAAIVLLTWRVDWWGQDRIKGSCSTGCELTTAQPFPPIWACIPASPHVSCRTAVRCPSSPTMTPSHPYGPS